MSDRHYERQHPAFYALLATLIFMAVGPIVLMFANSFKLDVDIISGTTGLLFLPTIETMKPRFATFCRTNSNTSTIAR